MTDWNLIIQGNISLLWIQECLKSENSDKKIGALLKDFKLKYENCDILNPGTLFMATYLLFLYPKESELTKINIDDIDTEKLQIITLGTKLRAETDKTYLLRRIRNSIAHGNIQINRGIIVFKDNNKSNTNPFKAKISIEGFGNFINNFMFKAKDEYFKQKNI